MRTPPQAVTTPGQGRPRGRARRRSLTVKRVVDAALHRVRTSGLDSVTMRQLAADLDTAPMSLYRHVADRGALMVLLLDRVVAELVLPPESPDPREEITGVVSAIHGHFRNDPWVVSLVASEGLARPGILPAVERVLVALTRAGLSREEVMSSYALIWHFAYGEAISHTSHARTDTVAREVARTADPETFPTIASLVGSAPAGRDYFDANLQRLLDGILRPLDA